MDDRDLTGRELGILQAQRQLLGLIATADGIKDIGHDLFNIAVPEPGKVLPINHGMAHREEHMLLATMLGDQAHDQVEGGWILDEGEVDVLIASLNLLQATKGRTQGREGLRGFLNCELRSKGGADSGGGIIDVMDTR